MPPVHTSRCRDGCRLGAFGATGWESSLVDGSEGSWAMHPFIRNGPRIGMRPAIRWTDGVRESSFREMLKNVRDGNSIDCSSYLVKGPELRRFYLKCSFVLLKWSPSIGFPSRQLRLTRVLRMKDSFWTMSYVNSDNQNRFDDHRLSQVN